MQPFFFISLSSKTFSLLQFFIGDYLETLEDDQLDASQPLSQSQDLEYSQEASQIIMEDDKDNAEVKKVKYFCFLSRRI